MTDFNAYDPTAASDLASQWQDASQSLWSTSITFDQIGDQEWLHGDPTVANDFYNYSEQTEWLSQQAYDASWEAYYGPVNAEGYTAYDASMGYTSTDTSFIEPARSAGSLSMTSDNSPERYLCAGSRPPCDVGG